MSSSSRDGTRESRRAELWTRALIIVLFALIALGGAGAAQLAGRLRDTRLFGASDSATILAFTGVHDFAARADVRSLMLTPVGADSMVMKARVFTGDESLGTYAVRFVHEAPGSFRLRSTGRLKSGESSMVCSVDVLLRVEDAVDLGSTVGLHQPPVCNGARHESAVARIRNIGS